MLSCCFLCLAEWLNISLFVCSADLLSICLAVVDCLAEWLKRMFGHLYVELMFPVLS